MSSTDDDITLTRPLSVENGGSPITTYSVEINDGTDSGPFSVVGTYDGVSVSITLNRVSLSLTTGTIYKIKVRV